MLALGAGIVIATNLALRSIRARTMAYFGARIDSLISMKSFEVILNMPVSMIESAPIGTQISRLKQFESMRDFFTGTLASSLVDIPFIFIFIIAIAIWGGHLVWVPVSLIADLCRARCDNASHDTQLCCAKSAPQSSAGTFFCRRFSVSAAQSARMNAEEIWITRHRYLSGQISRLSHRARRFNNIQQYLGEALVSVSGIATLGLGALHVSNGSMTAGA